MTATGDVAVMLVGGPSDWAGKTIRYPWKTIYGPGAEPGAWLITGDAPPDGRQEWEDPCPRAVYAPLHEEHPAVWGFYGWFPASAADGEPEPNGLDVAHTVATALLEERPEAGRQVLAAAAAAGLGVAAAAAFARATADRLTAFASGRVAPRAVLRVLARLLPDDLDVGAAARALVRATLDLDAGAGPVPDAAARAALDGADASVDAVEVVWVLATLDDQAVLGAVGQQRLHEITRDDQLALRDQQRQQMQMREDLPPDIL